MGDPRIRGWLIPLLALTLTSGTGCAQYMAINQVEQRDCRTMVLHQGVPRDEVVSCFGAPSASTPRSEEELSETYLYMDGGAWNHTGWKLLRVSLYTAADLFSLFLSQLITMPAEAFLLDESSFVTQIDFERDGQDRWRTLRFSERTEAGELVHAHGIPTGERATNVASAPPASEYGPAPPEGAAPPEPDDDIESHGEPHRDGEEGATAGEEVHWDAAVEETANRPAKTAHPADVE